MIRVEADLLIPGQGDPIPDGCVTMRDGVITYAGPRADSPATPGETTYQVPVVMPGMWDCHAHFFGTEAADLNYIAMTPLAVMAVRAARDAHTLLMAGFTSVREMGGVGVYLSRLIDEGTFVGPSIYAAGGALSPTGGHSDLHWMPVQWRDDLEASGKGWVAICDGVDECLKAVRGQLRLGAKVIKICATGGTMSEFDDPVHRQFNDLELVAIVEESALADRAVGAHCHGKAGIIAALEAGVTTIEHGSALDEEAAQLMLDRSAVLVPTRFAVEYILSLRGKIPEYSWQQEADLAEGHRRALGVAISAGVKIAVGADIMMTGDLWGRNGEEVGHLVSCGMTPLDAIGAATANGPLTLGPQAPQSGILAEGFDADVIAIAANPLDDVSLLGQPDAITMVWKGGQLVKSPEGPVSFFR